MSQTAKEADGTTNDDNKSHDDTDDKEEREQCEASTKKPTDLAKYKIKSVPKWLDNLSNPVNETPIIRIVGDQTPGSDSANEYELNLPALPNALENTSNDKNKDNKNDKDNKNNKNESSDIIDDDHDESNNDKQEDAASNPYSLENYKKNTELQKKVENSANVQIPEKPTSLQTESTPLQLLYSMNSTQRVNVNAPFSLSSNAALTDPGQCCHGNLSLEELINIKIRKRNVCYVLGLPIHVATEQALRSQEWFGQFGNIATIAINRNSKSLQANSIPAHITYDNDISAINAINFCNTLIFDDGRKLKATFGTQHYCRWFIAANKHCTNVFCGFRHSWCRPEDVITQKDLNDFKAIPAGAYTARKMENMQQNVTQKIDPENMISPTTSTMLNIYDSRNLLIEQIQNRNYQLQLENERLSQQIKILSDIEIKNKQEIHRWWTELAQSQQNEKNFQAKYDKLTNDFKTLQLKHDDLQTKYLALDEKYKLLINSNSKALKSWDSNDVIKWILNVDNKKYKKYENELIKNIKSENIDGQCLESLDKRDLHRLGIFDFKDKRDLLKTIKELFGTK